MSKNTHPATRALQELKAWRRSQREPARVLAADRWPARAVEAGVAAKLARRPTWDSQPRDRWWAALLDRVCAMLGRGGVLSW
jgi:hypothetical protein